MEYYNNILQSESIVVKRHKIESYQHLPLQINKDRKDFIRKRLFIKSNLIQIISIDRSQYSYRWQIQLLFDHILFLIYHQTLFFYQK